jgi:MoaA/NifB/PqqE/SkfB family radical SAM enzyme
VLASAENPGADAAERAAGGNALPKPTRLLIELTRACNLRCVHCAVSSPGYVGTSLPWPAFERILPALRRLKPAVELSGHGESLVYKRFFDAFAAVVDAGCSVSFITNAMLLTPELSERMVAYSGPGRWSHVTVSIDAAEPELFERLRRGARFERIVANLEALREARRRHATDHPTLEFNTVVMRDNAGQLADIVRLASRVGAESVTLVELLEYEHFSGHGPSRALDEVRAGISAARAEAASSGVRLVVMPGLASLLEEMV